MYFRLTQKWEFDTMGVEHDYPTFDEIVDGLYQYICALLAVAMRK